ncbi:oligopeptide ABC transporter substrate-binding protein [Miniphocaeibacter halophilus]|uniref:Oligopeptide ABC transporter substrate-binding protein n=1 Tax=Miniphocaeibacter halophilus TaxID=2931922 RepID=A0AC61NGW9_9FIRM|nr:oligopeptide ABC transporter substrate-binding protein [Miniphocaeibacter halophilus]QQK09038.1 oligopeptide ABC transporter substrate-binding protein [Miniphocaeibacter halophilus]
MKKFIKFTALFLSLTIALTACGGKNKSEDKKQEAKDSISTRGTIVENEGTPIKGGVLQVGLVSDSPFKGIFSVEFSNDSVDANITNPTMWGTFSTDSELKLKGNDAVDIEFDQEAKTATIKIKDSFKWSDGTPVTSRDFAFHYEIVADPEYKGVRYDADHKNIVGIEEFRNGEADTISGLETPDDKTLVITFKEFTPSILWGSGIVTEPVPYEYLKDLKVSEMEASPQLREKPLSTGPFVVKEIIPGQKVEFEKNEYYWRGAPKLDGVVFEVVPSSNVLSALKSGKYDLVTSIPSTIKTEELENLKNYSLLERDDNNLSYMGFKLGKWDEEKGEVIVDPNAKMANVNLRKAMAYALDQKALGDKFYEGLRIPANSMLIPIFKDFRDENAEGYSYDPEKAKKLLDEAGYKDVDNDGFREDPNGEKLVIYYATMSGSEVAEPMAMAYIQWWKEIGLNVELTNGRLLEFQLFYEMVENDDPNIDVFSGGWQIGNNPDQNETYSKYSAFNFSRYTDDAIQTALDNMASENAFDSEFRKQAYKDFDKAMFDAASTVPTMYRIAQYVVNDRIKYFDWSYPYGQENPFTWADIELTADAPIKE